MGGLKALTMRLMYCKSEERGVHLPCRREGRPQDLENTLTFVAHWDITSFTPIPSRKDSPERAHLSRLNSSSQEEEKRKPVRIPGPKEF
ncbi:hypothetical protein CEXT_28421 [Caerostris extrusa]|uniref:Uncharacterized protein n=1 Tax=Caerostris extrusa TaxID=172846 RepID=A0AAV4TJ44_CAEEX|nr:hypothetical protein CEXT_28421 [Caerostris extrusa]